MSDFKWAEYKLIMIILVKKIFWENELQKFCVLAYMHYVLKSSRNDI
jgi:hypothetical protein